MLCSELWNGIVGTVFSYSFLFFMCQFVADFILFQVASALSIWFQLIPGGSSLFQLFSRFSMYGLVPVFLTSEKEKKVLVIIYCCRMVLSGSYWNQYYGYPTYYGHATWLWRRIIRNLNIAIVKQWWQIDVTFAIKLNSKCFY